MSARFLSRASALTLGAVLLLGGCSTVIPGYQPDQNLADLGAGLAGRLVADGKQAKDDTLLVASLVDVDNMTRSSTFGRTLAEQVGSALAAQGYKVVEVKLRDTVLVKESTGELVLSRDVKAISDSHRAQALVAGTYGISGDHVYVSLRLIDPATGVVKGAVTDRVQRTSDIKAMLR